MVNRRVVVPGQAGHTWVAGAESGPARDGEPCLEGTVVWPVLGWCGVPQGLGAAVTTEQGHGKVWSAGLGTGGRRTGTLICRVTQTYTELPVYWYS